MQDLTIGNLWRYWDSAQGGPGAGLPGKVWAVTPPPASDELDRFFGLHEESRRIFEALTDAVETIGPSRLRVMKSQFAFLRAHPFAWAWMPEQYLRRASAPLVLTVGLRRKDPSPRWKEEVEPKNGRFTHHLELESVKDVDSQVLGWLREAWEAAEH